MAQINLKNITLKKKVKDTHTQNTCYRILLYYAISL